ncbi:MAG: acetoacetyl-CoA reductase [Micavibrio sp.]
MNDKIAIVTGGTRGIGLAITAHLSGEGYKVAALYHGNDEAAKQCERETGAKTFKVDVTDFDACQKACQEIEATMGPVAVLVNNAGITKDGVLHKMSLENWSLVLETNLTSCFNMCRAVVAAMRDRSYGRIINISSINGQKGQFGQVNYAAAKAGMIGFTKALALENAAKGITVNAVCPGYIATDMTASVRPEVLDSIIKQIPVGRMGTPDEIAETVAFLASEKAAFITGSTVTINGGQFMP